MTIDINSIKYLPDLPAPAQPLAGIDILHLNQQTIDCQITLTALGAFMANIMHPIGEVLTFGDRNRDPNTLFPGQTWVRVAQGNSIRGCKTDESDLGATAGNDYVTLGANNIPSHSHNVGTLAVGSAGAHAHNVTVNSTGAHNHGGNITTSDAGNHNHTGGTYGAGGHSHNFVGDDDLYKGGAERVTPAGRYDADSDTSNTAWWYKTSYENDHSHKISIDSNGSHAHSANIQSDGNHTHVVTVQENGAHVHGITGSVSNTGGGVAFAVLPKTVYFAIWKRTA